MIVIDAPYFYAGVVLQNGVAVRCAPIVKYMHGWAVEHIKAYCTKKQWRTILL